MPPTDQVPVYFEGEAVGLATPLKVLGRAEVRRLKKERSGYFVSHGRAFVLRREAVEETALRDPVRDTPKTCGESGSIQPPTMNDYVTGRRTARVAVDSWRS